MKAVIIIISTIFISACVSAGGDKPAFTKQTHYYKFVVTDASGVEVEGALIDVEVTSGADLMSDKHLKCITTKKGECVLSFLADRDMTNTTIYKYRTDISYKAWKDDAVSEGTAFSIYGTQGAGAHSPAIVNIKLPGIASPETKTIQKIADKRELKPLSNFKISDKALIEALDDTLKDAPSSRFKNIKAGADENGIVTFCGRINSKNSYGAYSGYEAMLGMVMPDGGVSIIGIGEAAGIMCRDYGLL